MTLDEAIQYAKDLGTEEENKIDYDKDTPHTIIRKKNTVKDYRQLAEWLRELKEAKRLLKAAVEDFNEIKSYLSEPYSHLCDKWRYADEALKLLGDEPNGI